MPPSRAERLYAETAEGSLSTAKESAVAYDRATQAQRDQEVTWQRMLLLESRVQVLEASAKLREEHKTNRAAIKLAILGAVGGLVVGLILFAVQFAATTKADAVKQSQVAVDRKIENSQKSTEASYGEGQRVGTEKLIAEFNRQFADRGLILLPSGTVHAVPPKSTRP